MLTRNTSMADKEHREAVYAHFAVKFVDGKYTGYRKLRYVVENGSMQHINVVEVAFQRTGPQTLAIHVAPCLWQIPQHYASNREMQEELAGLMRQSAARIVNAIDILCQEEWFNLSVYQQSTYEATFSCVLRGATKAIDRFTPGLRHCSDID